MKNNSLTYIELFAGAGGLAEGFNNAGFTPVAFIEKDKHACYTLKTRVAYHFLKKTEKLDIYKKYLMGKIPSEELYSRVPENILSTVINGEIKQDNIDTFFKAIEKNMSKLGFHKIDVIIGGPPCQSYSLVGRARDPYRMEKDPRNFLYKLYVMFLKRFKPDMFVFENVPGLLSAGKGRLWKDVQTYMKSEGYNIWYAILNAYDFGVLQNRKRVIIIGWKKEMGIEHPIFEREPNIEKYRVADLFMDLPPIKPGEKKIVNEYVRNPTEYLRKYNIRKDDDILTLHITRNVNERDRAIYRFYIEAWFKEKRRPAYDELPEYLKTHRNRKIFIDRFKVVAPDLPYSQTLVAHLEKDGHYYIHPDINQLRSISVREAARIQSFPDDFYFEGPLTAKYRQIGNAVPPLMAKKIADKIKVLLQ